MLESPEIVAQKKTILQRELNIDVKSLFKAVAKVVLNLAVARPVEASAELPEVAASLGLAETEEGRTWNLIFRGFERAICELLREYYRSSPDPASAIAAHDWDAMSTTELTFRISADFFASPAESEIIRQLSASTEAWLVAAGLPTIDAANMVSRLPGYFALGLHNEWRSNPSHYAIIADRLDSPFLPALTRQLEWSRYRSVLSSSIDEPIFDETFSLKQIYLPSRAYYLVDRKKSDAGEKSFDVEVLDGHASRAQRVVWLAEEIERWICSRDQKSPVRLLSGGPGSGKSSFAKIIAASLSCSSICNVVFIPLHLLDFNVGLSNSIDEFLKSAGHFSESPLDNCSEASPVLLILDGLDELQMQGQASQAVAAQLVRDVCRLVDKMNINAHRISALITGRELSVQSAESQLKGEGEILHIIPYHVEKLRLIDWVDPDEILSIDQRDEWWCRYGELTGIHYPGIPSELKGGELGDVTSQPLLNYLVALSHRRGGVKLDANTNINSVYADLLTAVYERGWAKNPHPAVEGIGHGHFVRLLEEVALSVWHGAGRTATLKEVEEHCRQSRIANLLPGFEQGASSGLSNLLLAFYFRQKGRREDGDKTFEFTHKTFAEYLTALRVVRALEQISQKVSQHEADSDEGWDDDEAMFRWLSVCGKTRFDSYIIAFIRRELRARGESRSRNIQRHCSALFSSSLVRGWPMQRFPSLKFAEQQRWARNAEEGLFASINACAIVTKEKTRISWPLATSFGEFVRRVQGQRRGPQNVPLMDCLSYLDLSGACLDIGDFYGANLESADFSDAALNYTMMSHANLTNAVMIDVQFLNTNLAHATLTGTKFSDFSKKRIVDEDLPIAVSHHGAVNLGGRNVELQRKGKRRKSMVDTLVAELERRGAVIMAD